MLFGDDEQLVVDFVATKDIAEGEELSFDYGIKYWLYRTPPEGDSRNFSDPRYRQRPPEVRVRDRGSGGGWQLLTLTLTLTEG